MNHSEFIEAHRESMAASANAHGEKVARLEAELTRERDSHRLATEAALAAHETELDCRHETARRAAFDALKEGLRDFREARTYAAAEAFAKRFREVDAELTAATGTVDNGRLLGFAMAGLFLDLMPERYGSFTADQWCWDGAPLTDAAIAATKACRQIYNVAGALDALAKLEAVIGSHASSSSRASAPDSKARFELLVFCRGASYERRCRELDAAVEAEKIAGLRAENELARRARAGETIDDRDHAWHEGVRRLGDHFGPLADKFRGLVRVGPA